jgi:hypothetical protein
MSRKLAAAVLVVVGAAAARADVPPPAGFKRVTLDHQIETDREYPEYAFFTVVGGERVAAAALAPKTPLVIAGAGRGGRGRGCSLVAVPKDAARGYATEKEFHAAVAGGKVPGLVRAKANFDSLTTVTESDPRKVVVEAYKVEKIDAKEGIVLRPVKAAPAPKSGSKDAPEDDPEPASREDGAVGLTAPGGGWVAGLAAFAALALGGLWLARRGRSSV